MLVRTLHICMLQKIRIDCRSADKKKSSGYASNWTSGLPQLSARMKKLVLLNLKVDVPFKFEKYQHPKDYKIYHLISIKTTVHVCHTILLTLNRAAI
jgi:hypothetical protein